MKADVQAKFNNAEDLDEDKQEEFQEEFETVNDLMEGKRDTNFMWERYHVIYSIS